LKVLDNTIAIDHHAGSGCIDLFERAEMASISEAVSYTLVRIHADTAQDGEMEQSLSLSLSLSLD